MAHKVNPIIFRLNISKKNNSEWFSKTNYPIKLHNDFFINSFFNNISEQYRFMFEKCKIKEYMGIIELRVFVHPYAFRKNGQNKAFKKFIITANRILPIIKNQFHSSPVLKIINLPKTVPKKHLKTLKYYLRTFKWKFLRIKKMFIRHLFVLNTAIYRSSSVLVAGMIVKGLSSRNRNQKIYFRFVKSIIGILFKRRNYRVKGIRVTIRGKIFTRRRSRRSRKMQFAFGTIPYSTITADINYNLRHIKTKYGVFSVRVWIYNQYPKHPRKKIKPKIYTNFIKFIYQKEVKNKKKKTYLNRKKRIRKINKKKAYIYNYKNKKLYYKAVKKFCSDHKKITKKITKFADSRTSLSFSNTIKHFNNSLIANTNNLFYEKIIVSCKYWDLIWFYKILVLFNKYKINIETQAALKYMYKRVKYMDERLKNILKIINLNLDLRRKKNYITENKIFLAICFKIFYKIKVKKIYKKGFKLRRIHLFYKIKRKKEAWVLKKKEFLQKRAKLVELRKNFR